MFSCTKETTKKEVVVEDKSELRIVKNHVPFTTIKTTYKKEIEDWDELYDLNVFLEKFEKIAPNEALSNALELRDLVKSLKDSVIPVKFKKASLLARVNVLHNETLRLADITLIQAATADDVNNQVAKTLEVFSSLNAKINTILLKEKFEDDLDIDVSKIAIDTTKIDNITKESIKEKNN